MNDDVRSTPPRKLILLGAVSGAVGVRGEVKLLSWTDPRAAIFRYQPWILRAPGGVEREVQGARGRDTGKHVVATLPGDATSHSDLVDAPGPYTYCVRGFTSSGSSGLSCCDAVVILPPVDLACSVDGETVHLTWTNGASYSAVQVWRDGALVEELGRA